MDLILLQIVEETQGEETMSLLSLLFKGGLLLIPILILSIIAVYIFIERYLTIKKASNIEADFMSKIKDYVVNGNIESALELCRNTPTPVARMIEKGIIRIGKPLKNIEVAIENIGKLEIYKLERGLSVLATIAGAAPMLGFLGTVVGMIRAFFNLASEGANIDVGLLAGGIYEALITTAVGLAVGIIAFIAYNSLITMIDKVIHRMEATSVEFIDLLQEPA
ncbi:MAG: MotA/TolQ/ExbB proton channel family protein [Chitinophagaceae bacterium]|nr:MAG: MotA/TolQ/ExbB proton channel family protein [Chitinophagaceae bacterium]